MLKVVYLCTIIRALYARHSSTRGKVLQQQLAERPKSRPTGTATKQARSCMLEAEADWMWSASGVRVCSMASRLNLLQEH